MKKVPFALSFVNIIVGTLLACSFHVSHAKTFFPVNGNMWSTFANPRGYILRLTLS